MQKLIDRYRTTPRNRPASRAQLRTAIRNAARDLQAEIARTAQIGGTTVTVRPTREGWAAVDVTARGELQLALSHGEMDEHKAIETFARLVGTLI